MSTDDDIESIKARIAAHERQRLAENEAHVRAVASVGSQVGRLRYDNHEKHVGTHWLLLLLILITVASEALDLYIHATG